MKNRFDLKLTISMVSLFIGLLLVILGNQNKYCLSFGIIFIGLAVILFCIYKTAGLNRNISELDLVIDETDDIDILNELSKERLKKNRQKIKMQISFYLFGALLIIVGFCALI